MRKGQTLTNMHGHTLKVGDWEIYSQYPTFKGKLVYDRDYATKEIFGSIYTEDGQYQAVVVNPNGLYVLYHLKYVEYNELYDIRKSYLYGNKYNAKASATRSNPAIPGLSKKQIHRRSK